MSVYCTLFSQTFYGLLFCYLTNVHVTLYVQIIDFQFPSCCTSQPPKKLNQTITVNSSTNTPRSYHQKNNSCTLCVPMLKEKTRVQFTHILLQKMIKTFFYTLSQILLISVLKIKQSLIQVEA